MKHPTQCSECEEVVELHALHLRVRCDCHPDDHCDHGICDACLDEYATPPEDEKR